MDVYLFTCNKCEHKEIKKNNYKTKCPNCDASKENISQKKGTMIKHCLSCDNIFKKQNDNDNICNHCGEDGCDEKIMF